MRLERDPVHDRPEGHHRHGDEVGAWQRRGVEPRKLERETPLQALFCDWRFRYGF